MADIRKQVLSQIRAARQRLDADVLDGAERMARHQMGLPEKPSLAVELFLKAQANGGRERANVLRQVESLVRGRGKGGRA
ncbi:MAG: hypothetical protein OHK0024_15780 [Thalassobaculales bacterium]